ncbi:hypothetical protein [Streptomyces alfalfae]|uniref:Uncharacterized protein n=1 Tax=Streptomyces alfalfae TaxID=1642299 RepID=A0A7T4PH52_9ACTN|nr:hypothetical protein [Streptomyces alfalfae]QQC90044.1 hypothetical protein I8755_17700 [Streptomyces alfalfae]
MGKPDTRRLDREIQQTTRKLAAVQNREMWPLEGRERRAILSAVATSSVKVVRHKSTTHDENRADTAWNAAEMRLNAEIIALQSERQRIVNENAKAKAAKKSSGWW